jgi:hypothetical protein
MTTQHSSRWKYIPSTANSSWLKDKTNGNGSKKRKIPPKIVVSMNFSEKNQIVMPKVDISRDMLRRLNKYF